ncbi:MAG: NAD(P)-binding protein [Butyrivibrio sp.]|nr:NAD(P)-binding protein [Butyrivibrio sp.]
MIRINQIKIEKDVNRITDENELRRMLVQKAAKLLRVLEKDIADLRIIKHSLDCRKKPQIFDVFMVDVALTGNLEKKVLSKIKNKDISLCEEKTYDFREKVGMRPDETVCSDLGEVVVIGSGPAGLFCAYELSMCGFKPLLLERGSDVDKRMEAVDKFWQGGKLDTRTNVQFGEGGAGTFSDGKLNTMVKDKEKRGLEALKIFALNGAPEKIRYEAKPHIGTDILCHVVKSMRQEIIERGGKVLFESQVTDLEVKDGSLQAVFVGDTRYPCKAAVLAIGHSARDTFYMLRDRGVSMEKKPFAVGFRVEHPQKLINMSQYGIEDPKGLPAAAYKLVANTDAGRGVYSFCMCPGGYVVNASSEEGMLAVNGMSYSARNGENANSAIIITVDPGDFGSDDVLSGVEFQRGLEKKAFDIGKGNIPVEYYRDFKDKNPEPKEDADNRIRPNMKGAYRFAPVHEILPGELNEAFCEGMEKFGRMIKGYNDDHALVSGVESRTSSPVRIMRDAEGESVNISGLYPCGEGAGYAGGIMSAAMDGIRTAELVARRLLSHDQG